MNFHSALKCGLAGIAGGFIGNGVLGLLFTSGPVRALLYDPGMQSELFLSVTPTRDIPYSIMGLVGLSAVHGWLYAMLQPSIPGDTWLKKGLAWGGVIWAMYWLFQEWFVYHTLLGEPLGLAALELFLLLIGSLTEGVVIARLLQGRAKVEAK